MPIKYTLAQLDAVRSESKQTLVIAGPGSGKTTVIVERVVHLLTIGCNPAGIVLLTYTNAGAKEMQERIAARLCEEGMGAVRLGYVGTLHSYCLRLLERYGAALGYSAGLGVLEEERSAELLKAAASKLGVKATVQQLAMVRDEAGTNCFERKPKMPVTLVMCEYYRQLRSGNMVDFAGLLTDGARLWRMGVVPPIEHLLVDEYQDSTAQDQDFYFAVQSAGFTFVGDPDQAIYGFRGGSLAALIGLSRLETWRKVWLQENHRCDGAICVAAQRLIEKNVTRVPKVTASATGGSGYVELLPPPRSEVDEAAEILRMVEGLLLRREVQPQDVAILARTNAAVSIIATAARGGYQIPLARAVEEDTLPTGWQYAKATVDVLTSPLNDFFFRYWLALRDGPEKAEQVARNAAVESLPMAVAYHAGLPTGKLGGQLPAWQAVSLLDAQGVAGPSLRRMDAYLAELPPDATLSDLALALRAQRRTVGSENLAGVNIRTIHSAKGLEWPVVFVAGLEQEVTPGGAGRDVEEERRLVYVAATRAKHRLVLSYALSRAANYGRKEAVPHHASQFLAELGVAT